MPGIKIGYLEQEPHLDPTKDVRGNVMDGLGDIVNAQAELDKIYAAYAEPEADFDKLAAEQAKWEAVLQAGDGHNIDHKLEIAADALRLPPWDADVAKISGGERRRVALCRLLLSQPDMLLLDEPTNHLDALSIAWLEKFLENYPELVVTIFMIATSWITSPDGFSVDPRPWWYTVAGQLLLMAGAEGSAAGTRREKLTLA
ncbi:MAG: ATP-binding cassette domain-containing protein [Gammaproteobacteria bacterium]